MTKRIGIDLASAAGQKTGLGVYAERLYNEFQNMADLPIEFVPITTIQKDLRTPERIAWDQLRLPRVVKKMQLDGLFMPAFSGPKLDVPMVMTAHDIYGVMYPERFSGLAKRYWTKILPESFSRANHICTVSQYTKRTIEEYLGIESSRMTVVPLAADESFRVLEEHAWVQQRLDALHIEHPFILSVGTIEPRKNYARLIEAFAFSQRGDAKLVIVGKQGWDYDDVFSAIRKYQLHDAVKILNYVEHDQLIALYNACDFVVLPSLFEGFGLPALEAMQCGAPVAAADNTSLPEVIGEAGVLFDPYSIEMIRERMDLLFTNHELRGEMQQRSYERSKTFAWETTARKTAELIVQYT